MKISIIGGGPAGITASYNILRKSRDIKVYLIEKSNRLGGLAKSTTYGGKFTFDIGPKRFHSEDKTVLEFIGDIGKYIGMIRIGRSSKVLFKNRFLRWPLGRSDLFKLPIDIAIRSVKDLLSRGKAFPQNVFKFKDYIINYYGGTLYEAFFRPYTEKFLHISAEHIHRDWASAGINRAIIRQERKDCSLAELFSLFLFPFPAAADFLYPEKGGLGNFWDTCVNLMEGNKNLSIEKNTIVRRIARNKNGLLLMLSNGKVVESDYIFWSAKLPELAQAIWDSEAHYYLPYIDTIFIDLVLDRGSVINKDAFCQWLYTPSVKYKVSRISFPKAFNKNNIPAGYEGLCAEITIKENERTPYPDAIIQSVIEELFDMGIFKRNARILYSNVHREFATYPVYHVKYKNEVSRLLEKINIFSKHVIPIGRSGSFWYNNMDHAIKQALFLTDDLLNGRSPAFDHRKYF